MKAREQLVAAHKRMTPEEIADHALGLAQALEHTYLFGLKLRDVFVTVQTSLDRGADLHAAGFKQASRELLRETSHNVAIMLDETDRSMELAEIGLAMVFNPYPERTDE